MNNNSNTGLFFLGLFISIGLISAGFFTSQTLYNAKVALNTAEAKGLAERRVTSDRSNWSVGFSLTTASKAGIPALYKKAEQQQKRIIELIKQQGFNDNEIKAGVINYNYSAYRDQNQKIVDEVHALQGAITLETDKVTLVGKARSSINKLIAEGINIQNQMPTYRFTKLNEIKPEMLREATKNARLAANEFADSAGASVGKIRDARQGSFYIRDAGEEYGDTQKIEKDVRVVTTITFYLTD